MKKLLNLLASILIITNLASCTTIEVAANLGKKIIPKDVKKGSKSISNPIYKIGNPYKIQNKTYYPKKNLYYNEKGIASWYGPKFHGKLTANGEIFDQYQMTAAHKTLPMPSVVQVINLENGLSAIVRINDRGPFVNDRIIDLSTESAKKLKLLNRGTGPVRVILLRSESIYLEKLAKAGKFPEINEIKKFSTPPIKKPVGVDVKITNIKGKDVSYNPKLDSIKKKIKVLKINDKKFNLWVQIASFSNKKSAIILKNKFNYIKNIKTYKALVNGKNYYRVRIGPYKRVEDANKDFDHLILKGMEGTKIIIE